nr:putative integron gene cassette protein [uncultured bacterium]
MVGVGLRESVKHGEHESWRYLRWHAFWPGNHAGSSWGIDKYGDERAYICACIAREHETSDRDFIEQEYQRIKGSAQYKSWLRKKALETK